MPTQGKYCTKCGNLLKVPTTRRKCFRLLFIIVLSNVCIVTTFILFSSIFTMYPTFGKGTHRQRDLSYSQSVSSSLILTSTSNTIDNQSSLCSHSATRRGPHQRVISVSLFRRKENSMFQSNQSLVLLNRFIHDLNTIYPDNFVLRVYHDDTITLSDGICPNECRHLNVDFCNMNSKIFIPPKIWRFLPAGDPLVDTSE